MSRILQNARILAPVRDPAGRFAWTETRGCLWLEGERVVAVGAAAEKRLREGGTPDGALLEDLAGRWVLPAFCDAHLHLHYAAGRGAFLEVHSFASLESLAQLIRSDPASDWVLGSGWRDEQLRFLEPNPLVALDSVDDARPVFLWSADHHRALVNRAARARLGLAAGVGGALLVEDEAERAWARVPARTGSLATHLGVLHRHGITAIGCFDRADSWAAFDELDRAGELTCRVTHSWPWEDYLIGRLPPVTESRPDSSRLRLGWVKVFLDGTLGSRTAWLSADYTDQPGNRGVERIDAAHLEAGVRSVASAGCALAFHAIGDRAVAAAVDAILLARRVRQERSLPELCDRVEHAELIDDRTVDRIVANRIMVSVQPCHLLEDIRVAPARWGDRCRGLLPLGRLVAAGVPMVFGTDYPIEELDPWRNLHTARDRRDRRGQPPAGFYPDERLDFASAFTAATVAAVEANGLPAGWGSLAPGAPADLQILECADPRRVTSQDEAGLCELVFAGRTVWRTE
ncbi:MAG: amidohydrolase [Planctomycetota bacterium]